MVQRAERSSFLLEPRAAQRVIRQIRRQNLHRHGAVEALIAGAPHFAHPAFAQLIQDFVVAQVLPLHLVAL